GERMDPQVRLAARGGETHPRRMVERRRLVGHQRGARNAAEVERRLVDGEDAEIDQARGDEPAGGIDDLVAVTRGDLAEGFDPPFDAAQGAGHDAGGRDQPATGHDQRALLLHAHPSTRRALRVSTSRQAMRMATPISTWSVTIERPSRSATVLSISTPRFIGPGCMTIASGAALASRSSVSP